MSDYGIYKTKMRHINEICQPLDFIGITVYEPNNTGAWGGNPTANKTGLPRTTMGWAIDELILN